MFGKALSNRFKIGVNSEIKQLSTVRIKNKTITIFYKAA